MTFKEDQAAIGRTGPGYSEHGRNWLEVQGMQWSAGAELGNSH